VSESEAHLLIRHYCNSAVMKLLWNHIIFELLLHLHCKKISLLYYCVMFYKKILFLFFYLQLSSLVNCVTC